MTDLVLDQTSASTVATILTDRLGDLAIEFACKLNTSAEICTRWGLSKSEMADIAKTDEFKAKYNSAKIAWGSAENAKERVALKAAMASESSLLRIHQLIHSETTPPSNIIDAHKHLSTLGALMPSKHTEEGIGNKHTIILNIGQSQGREPITVEGQVIESDE